MAACGRSLWDTPCGRYTRRDEPPGLAALPAQGNLRGQQHRTQMDLKWEKPAGKHRKAAFRTTAPHTRKSRDSVGTVKSHCKIVSENGGSCFKFYSQQNCGHSRGHCKHTLRKSAYHSGNTCTLHLPTTGHMSHCEHRGAYFYAQRNKCSLKCNGKKSRRPLCVRGSPRRCLTLGCSHDNKNTCSHTHVSCYTHSLNRNYIITHCYKRGALSYPC